MAGRPAERICGKGGAELNCRRADHLSRAEETLAVRPKEPVRDASIRRMPIEAAAAPIPKMTAESSEGKRRKSLRVFEKS
jgi:hypothetical protein